MKTSNLSMVDTNVLVYASVPSVPQHSLAKAFCDQALNGQIAVCLALQVVLEFFAIVTNPHKLNPPRTPKQAIAEIEKYQQAGILFLPHPVDFDKDVMKLLKRVPVNKLEVFDLQLAALMLANSVNTIYTYDDTVFKRVKGITVFTP